MSKHFQDARYYLGRAAEHAKAGIKEEVAPAEHRVRELIGGEEDEPEPSRVERLKTNVTKLKAGAGRAVREAVASARKKIASYRGTRPGGAN